MKTLFLILAAFLIFPAWAEQSSGDHSATDVFPAGQTSPEGAACDLARAFIKADSALWNKITVRECMGKDDARKYSEFRAAVTKQMQLEAHKQASERTGPQKIIKCYKARHLSLNGPASTGFALFNFQDVMFVDVLAALPDGTAKPTRTLVIKDKDDKWYVHPAPELSPLLSAGLNDESPSKEEFDAKTAVSKENLEKVITVEGTAANAKLGAQLVGTVFTVWIDGLHSWPDGYYHREGPSQRLRVTGRLTEAYDLPVFIPRKDKPDVQGIPVPPGTDLKKASQRFLLKDAKWEKLE